MGSLIFNTGDSVVYQVATAYDRYEALVLGYVGFEKAATLILSETIQNAPKYILRLQDS